MLLDELLQEKLNWTVLELIDAIKKIKNTLRDEPEITINSDELVFEVPAGEDIAPTLKQHLKPFIIKVQYDREGDTHKYHYFLHRPLIQGEIIRLKRTIN